MKNKKNKVNLCKTGVVEHRKSTIVYNWDGPMDNKELDRFITFYNDLCTYDANSIKVVMYFTTPGGSSDIYDILKDILENSIIEIRVVGHTELSSFGFYFMYFLNTKKCIKRYTNAVLHTISISLLERDLKNSSKKLKSDLETLNKNNEKIIELIKKSSLSKKKKQDFINGEDVFLNSDEVISVLEDSPYGILDIE